MMLKNICLCLGNFNKFVVLNEMKLLILILKFWVLMNIVFFVGVERWLINLISVLNKYFDEKKVFFFEDSYLDIESNKIIDK